MTIIEIQNESGKFSFSCDGILIGANNISPNNILKRIYGIRDDKLMGAIVAKISKTVNIFISTDNMNDFYYLLDEIQDAIDSIENEILSEITRFNEKIKQLNFEYSQNIANKSTILFVEPKTFNKITSAKFDNISDYLADVD